RAERAAAEVFRAHVSGQQNPAPLLAQPVVVLVVLVADELLVEGSQPLEYRARVSGEGDGVGVDGAPRRSAERGIADAEARAHADGNRPGDHGLADGVERSA